MRVIDIADWLTRQIFIANACKKYYNIVTATEMSR